MPAMLMLRSAASRSRRFIVVRSFSSPREPNLPANDNVKKLSARDHKMFARTKELEIKILEEPPVVTRSTPTPTGPGKQVYMGSTLLEFPAEPIHSLHAAALLDPKEYCKKTASASKSISGGDAARRLLRGKRNFLETMRSEVHSSDTSKSYRLLNHGVPAQLLGHLLSSSQTWMTAQDQDEVTAQELAVQNIFGALHFDRMSIRMSNGATRIDNWPKEWSSTMELYLTVMTRITNHLSAVLHPTQGLSPPRLKQWNVQISRNNFTADQQAEQQELMVQWTVMEGAVGRISVRLQGTQEVVLSFDGVYDTKQELKGSNFLW